MKFKEVWRLLLSRQRRNIGIAVLRVRLPFMLSF